MEIAAAIGVREVTALVDHAARVLAGFDPAVVMSSDAMRCVKLFDRLERFVAAGGFPLHGGLDGCADRCRGG
jgi:hypothetical protein